MSKSRPPSIKRQLMALYQSNIEGARQMRQQWAVDDYTYRLERLRERGSGSLPRWAMDDARRFGSLIRWPER